MDARNITVLAIDDQPDNLLSLEAVLSDVLPDAVFLCAEDGPTGIEMAKNCDPDVILLDIIMPDMDGFDVCAALKRIYRTQTIPILFLTALQTSREIRQQALMAGAEGFLTKPLDDVELTAQILTMAQIKKGNMLAREQRDQLRKMVDARTSSLQQEIEHRKEAEKKLQASHQLMSFIIEHMRSAVAVLDRNLHFIYLSQQFLHDYDVQEKNAIGKHHYDVFPDLPKKWRLVHKKCLAGAIIRAEDDPYIRADGRQEWTRWECRPWHTDQGDIGGIVIYTEMITERKNAEQALMESEKRFKTLVEQAPLGIALTDSVTGEIYQTNAKYREIVGRPELSPESHETWMSHTHPEDIAGDLDNTARLTSGAISSFSMNKRYVRPDGTLVWVDIKVTPTTLAGYKNPCLICMVEDISERKQKEEEILYLNTHDVLTGLYNRYYFDAQIKQLSLEQQLPFSLIIGDINGLKLVNDAFGQMKGDELLREVARLLQNCCRPEDIVARIGGDEFGILLPNTSADQVNIVLDHMYAVCSTHKSSYGARAMFGSESASLSISLGCGTKSLAEETVADVFKSAEEHMYRRKLLEQRSLHSSILASIQATMHEKSHETHDHSQRLARLTQYVGESLRLENALLQDLSLLSSLHDIGKIVIGDHILVKPGELTEEEWHEMKKHPEVGYRIAKASPDISHIAEGILCHHERWDGTGYPRGLAGEEIPLLSRILAVVDSFDAMTHERPYRPALTSQEALNEIKMNAGTQFDPEIAIEFVRLYRTKPELF